MYKYLDVLGIGLLAIQTLSLGSTTSFGIVSEEHIREFFPGI